ncbi:MAG: serine/threonine-protein kinase [Polyangiaceae bacterium]
MVEGLTLGRYTLHAEIASGGMATVYIGRLNGPVGFGRTVAIKRLHAPYARDVEFVKMFLDEARLCARIQHPNVVPTLDVVAENGELFLVLDFVNGESMSALARAVRSAGTKMPPPVLASVIVGTLRGLDAAHEARDERGEPLGIVHRDISPQNIMIGADGVARLLDFGVAKARARLTTTQDGHLKGKIPYMAPEQLAGDATRQSDIYAVGVVLWEMLAGRRLFSADTEIQAMSLVQRSEIAPPSRFAKGVPNELDRICGKALARSPQDRYASAYEMARDIDRSVESASAMRVSDWMTEVAGAVIDARAKLVQEVESGLSVISRPAILDALSAQSTPPAASPSAPPPALPASLATPREAATQVIATVSTVAKVADQAVRDVATKMAERAVRDVTAFADALKSPQSATAIKRAFSPLTGITSGAKKKRIERAERERAKKPDAEPEVVTKAEGKPKGGDEREKK